MYTGKSKRACTCPLFQKARNGPVTGMSHACHMPVDETAPLYQRARYVHVVIGLLRARYGPVKTSFVKQSHKCLFCILWLTCGNGPVILTGRLHAGYMPIVKKRL